MIEKGHLCFLRSGSRHKLICRERKRQHIIYSTGKRTSHTHKTEKVKQKIQIFFRPLCRLNAVNAVVVVVKVVISLTEFFGCRNIYGRDQVWYMRIAVCRTNIFATCRQTQLPKSFFLRLADLFELQIRFCFFFRYDTIHATQTQPKKYDSENKELFSRNPF